MQLYGGQVIENHIVEFHDMVDIGSGARREIEDIEF